MTHYKTLKGLSYLRKKANYTQKEFAQILGVERATVAMWEIGRSCPSAGILPKMADLLLCTIDDLYTDYTADEEACPCPETA